LATGNRLDDACDWPAPKTNGGGATVVVVVAMFIRSGRTEKEFVAVLPPKMLVLAGVGV